MSVRIERDGSVAIVTIDRPARRNAVDRATARALRDAFVDFDADASLAVAVLTGGGSTFCAGADLHAFANGEGNDLEDDGDRAPMGPTRLRLGKPVIAAIEGHAVAGGLELALWCDLRVVARDATLGVFCRRFGVPLIDLGTVRLPRIVGHGRAIELILTGRAVGASEALQIGLATEVVEPGQARSRAVALACDLARLPQTCMRHDRLSALEQWDMDEAAAGRNEFAHGRISLASGEARAGAERFASGGGRHGTSSEAPAAQPRPS